MAFTKTSKATVTGVLDTELDKTASVEEKKNKKDQFVKMEKPIKPGNKPSDQ